MEKYTEQVRVLDAGKGSWASDSARETVWNNFCLETVRHHRAKIKEVTDFRGLLFHIRGMYNASSGVVTQKTRYFQQEVVSLRHEIGDASCSAIARIAEFILAGQVIPKAIMDFFPHLQRDRLWAEEIVVASKDRESLSIVKGHYSTAWRLQLAEGDEVSSHPFYVSALGGNPGLTCWDFGPENDRALEVFFQVGRWSFGTEFYNGAWSPWRRALRREGSFFPAPGFHARQGDCFYFTPDYGGEVPQGEGILLEGVPELLRNVRFTRQSQSDENPIEIAVKEVREYPDFYKTSIRGEEVYRPAYRVELNLGDGSESVTVMAVHRDHALTGLYFREGGGNMLWAAEARGETDFRPRDNGGD